MQPIEIAKGIYEVGVRDWNVRDFHGYSTYNGTTYNAFLVVDEKIALIDTVRKEFADQMIANVSRIVDPKKIDLVVSNHTEMDHSGSLPQLMHRIGDDKPLYCSKMGHKNLLRHIPSKYNFKPVGSGDEIRLGSRTLMFLETRMLHWPDSMFTYLKEDQILFSSDAFGQHYAGPEKFDDEIGDAVMPHAKKYFANILLLYAPRILKLLEDIRKMGLSFKMICPDHGVIWRTDLNRIIDAYASWARQETVNKALVVYDTMWHSTERMAEAIVDGLASEGVRATPYDLRHSHRSDIMTEVLDAKAIVVGSPTLNNNMFPTVADFLIYMKGLKPQGKLGAAFGSYGWSGEAVKQVQSELESMDFRIVEPGLRVSYVPDSKDAEACEAFGRKIALAMKE
ncbi:MAG: FprA family A-type flavoprotein [Desulfobacterales bacterium]